MINLSWNGLANDGAKALGRALRYNSSLLELDVTCNRVNMEGAVALADGLRSNSALRWLKVGIIPQTRMLLNRKQLMHIVYRSSHL